MTAPVVIKTSLKKVTITPTHSSVGVAVFELKTGDHEVLVYDPSTDTTAKIRLDFGLALASRILRNNETGVWTIEYQLEEH